VVPLRNISGRADEDYLADGVTEAVMSALTQMGGLEVISRASANHFAETGSGAAALARHIRVDAWIEGTVLTRGDQVQVAVRLMESASESQVWSGTYERARPDVAGVQSDIATHLAAEIQLKVSSTERSHAPKRAPQAAAHDAYLRARFFWGQLSAEALRLSFKHFQAAVDIDPDYALAHAGLADWYLTAVNARLTSAFDGMAKARAAAMRALQLSPRLAQSHCSLGRVALHEWDLVEATVELEAALRLDPNLAQAELALARLHNYTGNFSEALQHVRVAQDLDPLSPATHVNAAATLYAARRFGEAIDEARRSLDLAPEFGNAVYLIGLCEHFRGNSELALKHLARAGELSPEHPSPASASGYVLAQVGRRDEALAFVAALKERATRGDVSPFDFAEAYTGLGETDLALEHLERSLDLRTPALLGIGSDPLFDPIRSEPRFQALLTTIGLA
jgi:adenylate cyclase